MHIITDRFVVGQNIAQTYSWGENTFTLQSLILLWYKEVANFSRYDVEKYQ